MKTRSVSTGPGREYKRRTKASESLSVVYLYAWPDSWIGIGIDRHSGRLPHPRPNPNPYPAGMCMRSPHLTANRGVLRSRDPGVVVHALPACATATLLQSDVRDHLGGACPNPPTCCVSVFLYSLPPSCSLLLATLIWLIFLACLVSQVAKIWRSCSVIIGVLDIYYLCSLIFDVH
jgi:hypothetical protein